jgi:hypothetical protein
MSIMEPTRPVALPDTPIYDAVSLDHGWSPVDLRAPLDADAMVAASYGTMIVNAAVAKSAHREG